MSIKSILEGILLVMISIFLLNGCSKSGNGITVLPATYSLSGTVSGDIRQGVTISVSGAMNASVASDSSGNYKVSGLPNGSYTVTPSKTGYTFIQTSTAVIINGANVSGKDFTANAVQYSINGTISGAVQVGVAITVTGTTEAGNALNTSATTSGSSFSMTNLPNGSYTVTAVKTGYSFSPASIAVTIAGGNGTASFTASVDSSVKFTLSGAVSGDTKAGVTINVTGAAAASASTIGDGTYTIPNLPNGTYTLSASKPGYSFSGPLSVMIDGANSGGNNFTAAAVLYAISGTVTGDVKSGVTITVTGITEGGTSITPIVTTTAGDGTYAATGVPNGTYTVVAGLTGYLFNPASIAVSVVGADSTGNDFATVLIGFRADGGSGANGWGGAGGQFYADSYGSIKVRRSGTLDAGFIVPTITPDFGAQPFTVNADTTVPGSDDAPGALCQVPGGDGSLYVGDGSGTCGDGGDTQVTGLTIASGVTLVLYDESTSNGSLLLPNDLVINGILTTDVDNSWGLSIEANLIDVETTGKITISATTPDYSAGEIDLGWGSGFTKTIINRGTIEAKGNGSGSGGYVYMEPNDLVANYGIIDVSGGDNGGSGGEFDAFVDYGDFYSSGTVRMNGGNGDTGGNTEYSDEYWYGYSCWIETAYYGNTNGRSGDIIISGIWEAKGGDGANGTGGDGGLLYFQTDAMGSITVNASMSVKGGSGSAGSWGGSAGYISFDSYDWTDSPMNPGTIKIAGAFDLRGGDSDQDGGSGGYLEVVSRGLDAAGTGSDVEIVGFPVMSMNGGQGGQGGSDASGSAFALYTYSSDGSTPASPITNEADVQARGGNATLAGGTGGSGGSIDIQTGTPGDSATILTNSGNIDVSGGSGDTGGSADTINLQAEHVENSGNLVADGGTGTDEGGNGGNITLTSLDSGTPTVNTGGLSVNGGSGTSAGSEGTITIDGGI